MRKICFIIPLILGVIVGSFLSQYQLSDLPCVIGKRALFLTTDKAPTDSIGQELNENEDFFYQATVTFTKNNKFAAAAHWFDGVHAGYGYFAEPKIVNDEMIIRVSDAEMLITKISNLGLFGTLTYKFSEDGIPIEVGSPKPGPALILLSNAIGQAPYFEKAIIWPSWIDTSILYYNESHEVKNKGDLFKLQILDKNFTLEGSSGSPVVQLQNGQLKLIGAHGYGHENLSAAVPVKMLIQEIDKIE